ncbi:MAG: ribosome maturation factor RimM [Bacilli bacterium]|jgi:16S rRNA processing protein RimM|nr:ribosome maturation factor RimM [Bacilli bacterium]MDD3348567.1 ribosome maturation factor RimM [Bacilli bacterium]MDD4056198.1 ribosome maturation factor RimM [Bacilli bacterium]MDY0208814.1 ribosome maturation factor RimM [Bacilli bacterium]
MEYYLVGTIVTTHGIKGEVKVKLETSFPEERFKKGSKLFLKENDLYREITINSYRMHKQMALITFNNLQNINDVLGYIGKELYVDETAQINLSEDDFYYHDLIGLDAFDEKHNLLGVVSDIMEVPQGEILVITKQNGKEALIPFVDEYIKKVNLEEKCIVIRIIEGLL